MASIIQKVIEKTGKNRIQYMIKVTWVSYHGNELK